MNKELKAGDVIESVQIAPFGEYKNYTTEGREVTQICDKAAFETIVKNFNKELIVDVEHKSELTDDSEAAGWLSNLKVDDVRGLVGDIKVSAKGAELLNGLNYRFGSPAFILDEVDRPEKLLSFALTNRPAMKDIEHVYNTEQPEAPKEDPTEPPVEEKPEESKEEVVADACGDETKEQDEKKTDKTIFSNETPAQETDTTLETQEDKTMNQELIKLLGLPEDATSEMVVESVSKVVNTLAEIKKSEEEKMLDTEASKFVEDLPEEVRDTVKNSYKENAELTKTIVNSLKGQFAVKEEKEDVVMNKEEAKLPDMTSAWETYNSLPQSKKLEYAKKHKDELK
jgi:phage I-like protein